MSELTKALCAFYKDVPVIHKDAKAQYGAFADLATVLSTVTPALYKNGLVVTQGFEPTDSAPLLITTLRHSSGEEIQSRLPMIVGSGRNPLHDFGGSVTYLRRYSLLAILGLAADVDTDGELSEPAPVKTSATPTQKKKPAAKKAEQPLPNGVEEPMSKEQREEILDSLKSLHGSNADMFAAFQTQFRKAFGLSADDRLSDQLQTAKHYVKAQDIINALLSA